MALSGLARYWCLLLSSFFKYEHLYQFINYPRQKHDNSNSIDNVHCPQIKICWPVRIFFSKKIHVTKLIKFMVGRLSTHPDIAALVTPSLRKRKEGISFKFPTLFPPQAKRG